MNGGRVYSIDLSSRIATLRNPGDEALSYAYAASTALAASDQQVACEESGDGPAFEVGPLFSARDENAEKARVQRNHSSPLVAALAQATVDAHATRAHLQGGVGGNVPTTLGHELSRLASPPLTRTGRRYQRGGVVVDVLEGTASRP